MKVELLDVMGSRPDSSQCGQSFLCVWSLRSSEQRQEAD